MLQDRIPTSVTRGALIGFALLSSSCTSNPQLSHEAVLRGVAERDVATEDFTLALEWAALEGLHLDPYVRDHDAPDRPGFWRACAWTWSQPCFEARRRFNAARASAASAGLPDDIRVAARSQDQERTPTQPDPGSDHVEVAATLDILGLLRLGRAPAAAALADARVREAFAEVERAAWRSIHDVDRARVRVAAARAREAALEALVAQVGADGRRIAVLIEHGWLPAGVLATAQAMSRRAERDLADQRIDVARALDELSRRSGLPPGHAAFALVPAAPTDGEVDALRTDDAPTDAALLTRLPALRSARLAYATAEATVRRAAAEAWPRIAVGPNVRVAPDSHLVGGVLDVALPWPGSVSGEIEAAVERRELARETLEDALREAQSRLARDRTALRQAEDVLRDRAPVIERETAVSWRAARARFSVEAGSLPTWSDSLERRIVGCVALIDAREATAVAGLDLRESVGPIPSRGGTP